MSGHPPYTYAELLGGNLITLGGDTLLYFYDNNAQVVVTFEGVDLFEPGCITPRVGGGVPSDHPEGSFNIKYPYCRTALRYRMDDPRSNPQIGQLVAVAPIMSMKIILDGCDLRVPINVTAIKLDPPQSVGQCTISLYPGYTPTEFYIVAIPGELTLPVRFTFTLQNGPVTKSFWIGIRDSRGGVPSGAVV